MNKAMETMETMRWFQAPIRFWLAIFSFFMLEIANQIHYNIPALPNSFLGGAPLIVPLMFFSALEVTTSEGESRKTISTSWNRYTIWIG